MLHDREIINNKMAKPKFVYGKWGLHQKSRDVTKPKRWIKETYTAIERIAEHFKNGRLQ